MNRVKKSKLELSLPRNSRLYHEIKKEAALEIANILDDRLANERRKSISEGLKADVILNSDEVVIDSPEKIVAEIKNTVVAGAKTYDELLLMIAMYIFKFFKRI